MKFIDLAGYWERLEKTSSRLEMTEVLAELFGACETEEIAQVIYLSLGRLGPRFENEEFNVAEKMMLRVIAQAGDVELDEVRKEYKRVGDVGDLSEAVVKSGKKCEMQVSEVFEKLMAIAKDEGRGSQERKVQGLVDLLAEMDGLCVRYVCRIPVGKLRLGFSEMTLLDGLSWMVAGDKSLHGVLEDAFNVAADVGLVAEIVKKSVDKKESLETLTERLTEMSVRLGTPVVPALCQRLATFDEVVEKMGLVASEPKYDGTRLQVHWKRGGMVRSFTRNLEENSEMFPELARIGDELDADEVVLDAEAIGVDVKTGKWLPFQVTMTRKRKHGREEQMEKVPIKIVVFDVLYARGKAAGDAGDIHQWPYFKRRELLEKIVKGREVLDVAPVSSSDVPEELREWHEGYLNEGLEGVIVKGWESVYTPGRKGRQWVKMKEVETAEAGLADTLDCIVMGYYRGRGKRASFGMGAFLVGVRGELVGREGLVGLVDQKILTVSKIGTGLSDEQFKDLVKRLKPLEVDEMPKEYEVGKNLLPDVWVNPEVVVEIAADNITVSKLHTAGLALRFPRLVKFRDDKDVGNASGVDEVRKLYEMQK